jgi:hypothetical protein
MRSAFGGWSQPVDATLFLEGGMECGLMGHKFHRGFTAAAIDQESGQIRLTTLVANKLLD